MIHKRIFSSVFLFLFTAMIVGCGGNVSEGVADGPDEPAPVLTEDEVAAEMEYTKSQQR